MPWKSSILNLLLLALCLVPLTGCLSQLMPNNRSSLTYEEAKAVLVAGKTTKEEVRAKFGKPDTISTVNGAETWTYRWSPAQLPKAISNAGRSMGTVLTSQAVAGISQPLPQRERGCRSRQRRPYAGRLFGSRRHGASTRGWRVKQDADRLLY